MATGKPLLKLQEVGPEQFVAAMDLQMRTFIAINERLHSLLFPGDPNTDPAAVEACAKRFEAGRVADERAGAELKYWQAIDVQSGEMAGCALWEFWPNGKPEQTGGEVTWVPDADTDKGIRGGELWRKYTQWAVDRQHGLRAKHIEGPYAQLEVCFTSGAHQRKGAGSLVIDAGLARAEELGLDCFIEASPQGRLLYETRGFRCIEEFTPQVPSELEETSEGIPIEYSFMKRPAGGWQD
ncbi:hypothetical protein FH972_024431 [Carpinus fangiana]|uniref:N-acetyltransferase domain-containing protein n=1 Tax=Carpinus fangiana TaxID=176857 RepID=A0A5N6L0I8_9ROSI|nr:hypothetical protein FH972_024431 [Carpinus fangiana]